MPRPLVLLLLVFLLLPARLFAQAPAKPDFSVPHGFHDAPFSVEITSETPGAAIRYTLDGSTPSSTHGELYTQPLQIQSTTVLRAVAILPERPDSRTATATYIFPQSVIRQDNAPPGHPALFAATDELGPYPADYEMDPEVVNDPRFGDEIIPALSAIPTISLVTDLPNLWDPSTGIYYNPLQSGPEWERPTSMELVLPDGDGFQVNAALRIHGNASRRPYIDPKKAFRVYFRSELGPGKLRWDLFPGQSAELSQDVLVLRGYCNNSWVHWSGQQRPAALYMNDQLARDIHLAMGHVSSHGVFVHVYLNGLYWGVYNAVERLEDEFMADYLGGAPEDWDVITMDDAILEARDGTVDGFVEVVALANAGLADDASYQAFHERVDVVSLADYIILTHYVENRDWPIRNWVAAARRGHKFLFFPWDNDYTLKKEDRNLVDVDLDNTPARLFQKARESSEFRMLFADRLYRHLFHDGALSENNVQALFRKLTDEVYLPVVAESARWGDYTRDVYHRPDMDDQGPYELYTRDDHWVVKRDALLSEFFPNRGRIILEQYRAVGLYPTVEPPTFSAEGGEVERGLVVHVDNSANGNVGEIHYTVDGTDPRLPGGAISATAVNAQGGTAITVDGVVLLRARVLQGTTWSALHEALFVPMQDDYNLVINEIMYRPAGTGFTGNEGPEFVELVNRGNTALTLAGMHFFRGLRYRFPHDATLGPGEFLVLAADADAFQARYGFAPFGVYEGKLNNAQDELQLRNVAGRVVDVVRYHAETPWPERADGFGPSLELVQAGLDNALPESWADSLVNGGTPGAENSTKGDGAVSSSSSSGGAGVGASSSSGGVASSSASSSSSGNGAASSSSSTGGSASVPARSGKVRNQAACGCASSGKEQWSSWGLVVLGVCVWRYTRRHQR
ncbi:MAG: CotH kinase family protein [Myxococcota bacterium]